MLIMTHLRVMGNINICVFIYIYINICKYACIYILIDEHKLENNKYHYEIKYKNILQNPSVC